MGGTSLLSMMEARMPPGFRFHPRDEELIIDYLAKRISNSRCQMMIDVDLNRVEPWDLPDEACVGGKEWYFYSLKDRKYATGQRTNRATVSGYWKATGKDRPVLVDLSSRGGGGVGGGGGGAVAAGGNSNGLVVVGMRKTLVFYKGRAPKGKKTDWVMHEFRMESSKEDDEYYDVATSAGAAASAHPPPSTTLHFPSCRNVVPSPTSSTKEDWVLCRVFYKRRALLVKPNSSSIPPTATATTGTTTTGDNCYDDDTAGSSSGAAVLMDTFMNMEQQPAATPQQHFSLQGYEQVPCFSSSSTAAIISSSSAPPSSSLSASKTSSTAPSSINYPTVAGAFPPFRSFTQLFGLPDVVVSPFLSPMEADQQYNKPPGHFAPPLQQINLLNKTTEAAAPIHMDRRVPSTVVNSSTDNSSGNFINNNQSGVQPMWS